MDILARIAPSHPLAPARFVIRSVQGALSNENHQTTPPLAFCRSCGAGMCKHRFWSMIARTQEIKY